MGWECSRCEVINGKVVRTSTSPNSQTFFSSRKIHSQQPQIRGPVAPWAWGNYPKCKFSPKVLQRPTRKAQSALNPSWGPGSPCVDLSVYTYAWAEGQLWCGGQRKATPRSNYVEGICYVSFSLPSLSPFSSSPSAFVWEDPGVFFWSTQSFSGTWVLIGWRT